MIPRPATAPAVPPGARRRGRATRDTPAVRRPFTLSHKDRGATGRAPSPRRYGRATRAPAAYNTRVACAATLRLETDITGKRVL